MMYTRVICVLLVAGFAHAAEVGLGPNITGPGYVALGAFDERVYNSLYASSGQLPYQALIELYNNDNTYTYCGAAIISSNYVLTAAHCITKYDISIFAGIIDTNLKYNQNTFSTTAKYTTVHPNYNSNNFKNDIAVILTWKPFPLGGNIQTIQLPASQYSNPALYDNSYVVVSGWGRIANQNTGQQRWLRYQTIQVMPFTSCQSIIPIGSGQVCTDKRVQSGPCQGDSGGPLAFFPGNNAKPFLVGLVSFRWGQKDSTGEIPCVNPNPEVYTNVAYYLNWIKSITG